ncbi:MAG: amidase [Gammaproteobacteria bacterium]
MSELFNLTATQAVEKIRAKVISSYELTSACLERINAREDKVHAWQLVDYEGALAAAKRADNATDQQGPLHGIPVGLKDIIDTAHLATTYGSKAFRDHRPRQNADCVNLLQEAGAIIVGKTVTTEFAFFAPGPTANPHNTAHTPGGSSSGSAAAVADFHVPLSLGTQTAGSIIRPASFNGIIGYKPSYDFYSNRGVHPLAGSLDTLGPFARSVDDLHLLNTVLGKTAIAKAPAARKPDSVVIVKTPYWEQASAEMRTGFERFTQSLEDNGVATVDGEHAIPNLNEMITQIAESQVLLMALEAKDVLGPIADKFPDLIRPETKQLIEQGLETPEDAVEKITDARTSAKTLLEDLLKAAEVILTPSALGTAPAGLGATGDPIFNRVWTFARVPCINLPIGRGDENLPIGVQFVGGLNKDADLLANTKYLASIASFEIAPPV